MKKELLFGGFRSPKSDFRKSVIRRESRHMGPTFSMAKPLGDFPKGALRRGNISRWALPFGEATWRFSEKGWNEATKAKWIKRRQCRRNENRLLHYGFSTLEGDFPHQMRIRNCKHGKVFGLIADCFQGELRAEHTNSPVISDKIDICGFCPREYSIFISPRGC